MRHRGIEKYTVPRFYRIFFLAIEEIQSALQNINHFFPVMIVEWLFFFLSAAALFFDK
jgi:hypothetical protein